MFEIIQLYFQTALFSILLQVVLLTNHHHVHQHLVFNKICQELSIYIYIGNFETGDDHIWLFRQCLNRDWKVVKLWNVIWFGRWMLSNPLSGWKFTFEQFPGKDRQATQKERLGIRKEKADMTKSLWMFQERRWKKRKVKW